MHTEQHQQELSSQKLNIILQSGIVTGARYAISEHKTQMHLLSKKYENAYIDSQRDYHIGDSNPETLLGNKALSEHYSNPPLKYLKDKLYLESKKLQEMLYNFEIVYGSEELHKVEREIETIKANLQLNTVLTKRRLKYKQKHFYHLAMLLTGDKLNGILRHLRKLDVSRVKEAREIHDRLRDKKQVYLFDMWNENGSKLSKDRRALYMVAKDYGKELLDLSYLMMAIIDNPKIEGYVDENKYLKNMLKLLWIHIKKIMG